MIKLEVGDKIYISKSDGGAPAGWAIWQTGELARSRLGFTASCGIEYDIDYCRQLMENHFGVSFYHKWHENYHHMMEQAFGDGMWEWEV